MLYVLSRIGMALAGLALGITAGWAGVVCLGNILDWGDTPVMALVLMPLIALSCAVGGVTGLVVGTLLPYIREQLRQARQARQWSDRSMAEAWPNMSGSQPPSRSTR